MVASGGPIVIFRSTNRFVAGPLPLGPEPIFAVAGSVSRVTFTDAGFAFASESAKCQTDVAFRVNTPAVLLLIFTVHV